jgi:flagellar basal body-associated protein FliL
MLLTAVGGALAPVGALADDTAAPPADAPKDASKDAGKKDEGKKGEGEGDEKKSAPKDISGGRFAGDPVYVHLSPMILPVITDTGAEQIVSLQITIEVRDFDSADTIHTKMPLVMDALMRALYGGLGNGDLRNGQLIDVTRIKAKCTTALDNAVGADNIRDVLIEAVAQRRL